jgi:lipoprotein-anchoring transpeptidase ErfK/SrfK
VPVAGFKPSQFLISIFVSGSIVPITTKSDEIPFAPRAAISSQAEEPHCPLPEAEMLKRVKDKGIEKRGLLTEEEFRDIVDSVLVAKR